MLFISIYRLFFPLLVMLAMVASSCTRQPVHPAPVIEGRDAVITLQDLKDDVPQFYSYRYQGKDISFFVLKMDGKVSSFFDACASCYPHKQGYRYEDGFVVCRYCNVSFPLHKLEKGIGGCYPIRLEGRIEKGRYLIPLSVIEAEANKF